MKKFTIPKPLEGKSFIGGWQMENDSIYSIERSWLSIVIAFIVLDLSGYWVHRLNHRVNILWNRHVIHHSSEEFNLACALRQSISNTFQFIAIFMIPAALLGIPAHYFVFMGPIHLFLQFWYHTQLIDKMGLIEHILVTPSHHRVHHAINSDYIDKLWESVLDDEGIYHRGICFLRHYPHPLRSL